MADKEPLVSDLGKFDPDDFDAFEDTFLNLLVQCYGMLHELLQYVVHPKAAPETFATMEERWMYQFPLTGNSFELDNQAIYHKLKAFVIDSLGWPGLSLMIPLRMVGTLIKPGRTITMEKVSSASGWQLLR